jgi:solute:Na+ symporter, SSS family
MKVLDWTLLVFLFTGLFLVALWCRKYVRGVADFVLAGRKVGMFLGLSTGTAEGIGLISIANFAQQGYLHGFSYIWIVLINMIIFIPVFGIMGFGIKRYRATKVQTLPQYYEMRYGKGVRLLAGIALTLGGVLNLAIFPIISSWFLTAFLGFPEYVHLFGISMPVRYIIMFIMIGGALLFALLGGLVTIIVTDYIQSIILTAGVFMITFFFIKHVGFSSMHETLVTNIGPGAFNPFKEGSYGIVWVLFLVLSTIFSRLSFPPNLQKISASESPEVVRKSFLIGTIFGQGRLIMILAWGVCALAMMGNAIPDGANKEIYQRTVTAMCLSQVVPSGVMGLALAGLVFAFITTVDSYLLSWSSVIVNDVICNVRKKPLSARQHIKMLRIVLTGMGVFLFAWGTYYKSTESIMTYLFLTGAIFVGPGIISFFGLYWKRTTTLAAYLALGTCIVIPMADLILKQYMGESYPLKGQESGLLAILLSVFLIVVVSLFSKKPTLFVDYGKTVKKMDKQEKLSKAARKISRKEK